MIEILEYVDDQGRCPYKRWFQRLRDQRAVAKIEARLTRIKKRGYFGDCEPVGGGVFELRIDYGPGYRVYFGREDKTVVLLLFGGDKSTQPADIAKAKEFWTTHNA